MAVTLVVAFLVAAVTQVAADTLQETNVIQLASELNVGYELVSKCTSYQYEASQLCTGLKPFKLYGDSSNNCLKYFWCSTQHGACILSCDKGTVFDQACNCCKPLTDSTVFDSSTCSSSVSAESKPTDRQQLPAAPALLSAPNTRRLRRRLLEVEPLSSTSGSDFLGDITDVQRQKARAKARARLLQRRRRREAAARATAAAVTGSSGDSITSDPSSSANSHLDNGASVWISYGKKYRGPWGSRNIVKEPALRVSSMESGVAGQSSSTTAAATTPASLELPTSGSGDAVANHRRRRLLQQQTAVLSAVNPSTTAASDRPAIPGTTTIRHLHKKRIHPLRIQPDSVQTAVADSAVDAPVVSTSDGRAAGLHHHQQASRHRIRPMDKKPAAKAVDPEDEQGAAFASAIAGTDVSAGRRNSRPVHVRRQRPAQPTAD